MSNPSKDARQMILQTAQAIVGRKGFSAVGLTEILQAADVPKGCLLYTSPSPRDQRGSRMPSSA